MTTIEESEESDEEKDLPQPSRSNSLGRDKAKKDAGKSGKNDGTSEFKRSSSVKVKKDKNKVEVIPKAVVPEKEKGV